MADVILTADTILTMDSESSRAEAVAVSDGMIIAVGSLADAQAALPNAEVIDTQAAALMPGFVEPHSHPVLSGAFIMPPARYIAPWVAPTWDDVKKIFADALAEVAGTDTPLLFFGFDALKHGVPAPTNAVLDEIFGDHQAFIADNSGHGIYFTSAYIKAQGWDVTVPADPAGGSFGRNADGSLNGQGFETPVVTYVMLPVISKLGGSALVSAAEYYQLLSRAGITSTSEMTFSRGLSAAYTALAQMPSSPLRVSLWEMSTEKETFDQPLTLSVPEEMVVKRGVKLWTDGSPWVGNLATSFPYLQTDVTKLAGIDGSKQGEIALNYGRAEIDAILDRVAAGGWSASFHANGDLAIDQALDAMERALVEHDLLGTEHGWRLEHIGAGRKDQFARAARLGVHVSMSPFQLYYWGDMLDGGMFAPEHGARWQAFNDALTAGANVSFHNDGGATPPTPILNAQVGVTRRSESGMLHGPEQAIDLHDALKAITINAAKTIGREALVGSIEVGKLADFVELNANPYAVDPQQLAQLATVRATWLGGEKIDLDQFLGTVQAVDAKQHAEHTEAAHAAHAKKAACC